ncbi:MAG: M48 family metallopeptidase [Thermodesulfobacteriota bacterium]
MKYLINQVIRSEKLHRTPLFRSSLGFAVVCLLVFTACATVPHTGRRQFNMLSDTQMNALGLKVFNEIMAREREIQDDRIRGIVKRVTERVSGAAEALDSPKFQWDVKVVESDEPNAVCLPGGKIVVFSGILPYARNEAGLAAVISHEIAHAVARHGGERLSQQLTLRGAIAMGSEILKEKDGKLDAKSRAILGALGLGGTLGVILPYSRTHELEADRIGQLYMARAGYDPSEGVNLWTRMAQIKKPPLPEWLSTHPADGERVRRLKETLPQANAQYAQAPVKYGKGTPL